MKRWQKECREIRKRIGRDELNKRLQLLYEVHNPIRFALFGGCIFHTWDEKDAPVRQCLVCGKIHKRE